MLERHKKQIAKILNTNINSEIIQNIEDILNDKISEEDNNSFRGFKIGDIVKIDKVKNIIISYDGKPEGFSEDDIGKIGKIVKFDKKTMSQKNVFIDIDGEIFVGDYQSLKHVWNYYSK